MACGRRAAVFALMLGGRAAAHEGAMYVRGPDDDWCSFINTGILTGDDVLLEPGEYVGPCTIVGQPPLDDTDLTHIRPLDFTDPPVFLYDGVSEHILRIEGEHIAVTDLVIRDVPEGVAAIRIAGTRRLWVQYIAFTGVAGTAVDVISGSEVRVERSRFDASTGPLVTFGCADGTCATQDARFASNLVLGGTGTVTLFEGSDGTIADNVAAELGAPLVVYAGGAGTIEGNLLSGNGPTVRLEDAEVLVRNNVLVGGLVVDGGAGVSVLGNTLLGDEPLVALGGASPRSESNAIEGEAGCEELDDCWEDAVAWDFRPVAGGPLDGAGVPLDELTVDFCGNERDAPLDAGALERGGGAAPLSADFKEDQVCGAPAPGEPEDSGGPAGASPDATPDSPGCGCDAAPAAPAWGWLLFAALALRRR